jgi:hypothetical protein
VNSITLINPQQAHAAISALFKNHIKPMTAAGNRLEMEIRLFEDAKSDRQRAYYHKAVLTEIAKQAKVNGQTFPMAVWKEHFRSVYLGFKTVTCVNPMTGKKSRRRVRKSTEDLGVKAYSDLIEKVTAFAVTELGVQFPEWIDPETGEVL